MSKTKAKAKRRALLFPVSKDGLIGAEALSATSSNGLIRLTVRFGMTRSPDRVGGGGEPEVREAFADIIARIREFADMLEGSMLGEVEAP